MISKPLLNSFRGMFLSFLFALITIQVKAQQFKLNQGIAITQFNYQNEQGQNVQGLKSGSGLAISLAFHKASLVAVLTKAIQEQQLQIEAQQKKIDYLLKLVEAPK